jgi:hypothetical protein
MANDTKDGTERYNRPTIKGWMAPLLVAPWASIYAAVSLFSAFGPEFKYVNRWVVWGIGMLAGTIVSFAYMLLLALVDILLLAIRVRQLPSGGKAWLNSFASPLAFLASYAVLRPWNYWKGGPWVVLAMVVVPMVVTAIVSRVAFGIKIQKS